MIYFRRSLLLVLLFLSTAAGFSFEYDPVAVYLTWQRSPESTMTVRWLTALDRSNDIVEYQEEGRNDWLQAMGNHISLPEKVPYLLHHIELTNLQPGTNYFFRTGHDGRIFKFKTMPASLEQPIRFVVGGDMYHDGIEFLHMTSQQAAKTAPFFALIGGDIAYAAASNANFVPHWIQWWITLPTKQKFDRWLTWLVAWKNDMVTPDGRLIPMLPAIGNHDVNGQFNQTPAQALFFYALFAQPGPQGYNVLDFGHYMSIILLDSDHSHPIEGQQTQWLAAVLNARKDVPHKFAIYHVPAYPSARCFEDTTSKKIRKNWVPIFDQFMLTAAFENHDHDYKRTSPMLQGKTVQKGVIYLGDGAWGVEEPRKPKKLNSKPYIVQAAAKRHFLLMTIDSNTQTVQAIDSEGIVFDEFSW